MKLTVSEWNVLDSENEDKTGSAHTSSSALWKILHRKISGL
jgi:hypothetical protein